MSFLSSWLLVYSAKIVIRENYTRLTYSSGRKCFYCVSVPSLVQIYDRILVIPQLVIGVWC